MIYHLADNGAMAVVLPHGSFFRTGKEHHIRKYLVNDMNYVDSIIGLPKNIFYGTETPTCILVMKKCRENPDHIFFIDASKGYGQFKTKNKLRERDIEKIITTYRQRDNSEGYAVNVPLTEIQDKDYNLGIQQYLSTERERLVGDEKDIVSELVSAENQLSDINEELQAYCDKLNIAFPAGNNISLLKQYKNTITHKLLSRSIRFVKDNGNQYPDWQNKSLGELFKRKINKNKEDDIDFVLTNSATRGIVSQDDYFDKKIANKNNLSGYYIVELDDFVYNPRISQYAPVGPMKRNKLSKGVMSPLYTVLTCSDGDLSFYECYFDSDFWHDYMRSVANYGARHDRMNITKDNLLGMPLPYPDLEEQKKIAEFLGILDSKIELITKDVLV